MHTCLMVLFVILSLHKVDEKPTYIDKCISALCPRAPSLSHIILTAMKALFRGEGRPVVTCGPMVNELS